MKNKTDMIDFSKKKTEISTETLVNTIWVSSFLAMIFTLPPLGLFLGIYFWTGDLVIGAIIGFGIHFVILAFSGRISKIITKIMS
jgi:hypothetical protein